jgi:class 3 adenylate cyclase/tetratricopeptide (TPR) repeat protein
MNFDELLAEVLELLQREQRVSYRAMKRRFNLDDDYLEDIKDELIYAKKLAMDEDNRVLVWGGGTSTPTGRTPAPSPARAETQAATAQQPPLAYTPQHLTEKILTSRTALEGERKQVTVLFADIKDSTELIKDLDPEAAQQLLDPAIHLMMEGVHRFEGTVNQVLGDGIMALFGAPIAHEDHALRACYASLAMQTAMRDYSEEVRRTQGLELRIRVGLNAGEVVVRTIGNDLHMDYSAVGPTTHLAARMEQLAMPGTIRLTEATLRLVEGLVKVNALGPIPVKGMTEPVEVYELIGASGIRRRLPAAVARGLTRFVGRETEIDALTQTLEQAGVGHGQVVAAVGEAGVGKSRLVYEFIQSYRTQGWLVLESASVSYGKATPYFPVVDLLKRYGHIEDGDDPRTIRAKLTGQVLTLDATLQETIPALLSLLEALPDDSPFLAIDPLQRRQCTLEALKRVLLRESQVQPLLLVFEDLHWIDSETQALLYSLIESLPTARLLLLVNYRPEYQHGWGSKTYYTQLRLDPLPPASAEAFLQALLGDDPSLEPLKQLLIERTEGNPFFLEESVRTLIETQVLVGEPGVYRLAQDLPTIQVPPTVQAILAARIDRLPQDEKRLLQSAAVIGTEVPVPVLQAIAEIPEGALHRGLTHLQAAEFLYETSLFPERVYTFKHALTHEVTYGSLLQERRRGLHGQIVEALEALAGDRLAEQVERLAHHAVRGEVWDKALAYCRQAGAKAMQGSAYREAEAHFEQALVAVQHLPVSRDTQEQAIDLRLDLRNALLPLGEHARVLEHLRAAETLAETLDDPHRLGRIASRMCISFLVAGEHDRAIASAQRALALGTTHGDVDLQVAANSRLGLIYYQVGDYRQALHCLQQTQTLLEGKRIEAHFFGMAGLPSVTSRARSARCHAELGTFAEGRVMGEEGVRIAETIDHPFSLIQAYHSVGLVFLRQGNVDQAIAALERGLAICKAAHIPLQLPQIAALLGVAYALAERGAEALTLVDQVVEQVVSGSHMESLALVITNLSEASLLAGRLDDAGDLAVRALALSRERKQRGVQARALWLLGEIALQRNPPDMDQAEGHYQQALALADELGMCPLQAHCHRDLGTLYRQVGQVEQARTALSTAIDLYCAMGMTFWLPQAEATLAQVAG